MFTDFFGEVIPIAGGFGYGCYRLVALDNLAISDFSVLVSAILQCRYKINNFARYFTMQQKHCLWVQSLREFLDYEPQLVDGGDQCALADGAAAIKATVKEKMELFGSVNKA